MHSLAWVSCDGKGSFLNSLKLKQWVEGQIDKGLKHVVVDLDKCTGMDSTFMGTLAGIAMKLCKIDGAKLEVAFANGKNTQSLEDLGLDCLMTVNPGHPSWQDQVAEIRGALTPCGDQGEGTNRKHVYEAHKTLCDADDSNNEKFATVLDCLEQELAAQVEPRPRS
ncbi:STAS domain-containing protein [Rubritalea marina]|uniref:STAS domain-containing protein n=1 Tax=Rubritalea marina TaxID=361055 RepID=UPI00036310D5|nr:STAS domain-containing protein [Rubritalea marina]